MKYIVKFEVTAKFKAENAKEAKMISREIKDAIKVSVADELNAGIRFVVKKMEG